MDAIRDITTFLSDRPKTDIYDRNSIPYELIRYGTYCPVK